MVAQAHGIHTGYSMESCVIQTSTPALIIHPRKGSMTPVCLRLSLSLGGHNGQFTMPVNVITAPCTFTSMTSLRQTDQRQNELSRSMRPFFLLLEQNYTFRDQHVTRQINLNTPSTQKMFKTINNL